MCEITCPCNEVPEDMYDFNIFHLKYKYRGNNVIKFYDHFNDAFYYQCRVDGELLRCGATTFKEAKKNFDNITNQLNEEDFCLAHFGNDNHESYEEYVKRMEVRQ